MLKTGMRERQGYGEAKKSEKKKTSTQYDELMFGYVPMRVCVCASGFDFCFFFSCVSVSVQHAWWQWWRGFNANQANTRHDGREWPQPAPPHMRVSVCIVCCLIVVMHICPALISKNPLPAQLWKQSIHRRSRSIATYFVLLIVI